MEAKYLFEDRNFIMPRPKRQPKWVKVTSKNVTKQTRIALDKLGEFFPNVSFFSWHPNIPRAQYGDDPKNYTQYNSNYNSRIWIGDSLIARSSKGTKSHAAVNDGHKTLKKALEHIPELETLGGSGSSDDDTKTYQTQISFLKTVGTHEEVKEIKNRVITHGAYSLYKGE